MEPNYPGMSGWGNWMSTVARVKGVKRYKRKGEWYCYHRASGTRLKEPFGTPAFFGELSAAERRWKERGGAAAMPGTLGMAILSYRASPAFTDLAPRTQADYQKVLDYLAPMDKMPLVKIDTAWVAKLRDKTYKKRKRRFANYVISVLGSVFRHCKEYGLVDSNPTLGVSKIKRPHSMPKANRPWTLQERQIVLAHASPWLKPAIALGMLAGLREGDIIKLPKNVRQSDGWLVRKTKKSGTVLQWPIIPALAEILDAAPEHDALTLVANSFGRPWKNENSFRSAFFKLIQRLERKNLVEKGLTFHGLKHTVGKLLKEGGASDEDIAIALGHKTVAMARHYSSEADNRIRMEAVVKSFNPLPKMDEKN